MTMEEWDSFYKNAKPETKLIDAIAKVKKVREFCMILTRKEVKPEIQPEVNYLFNAKNIFSGPKVIPSTDEELKEVRN